MREILSTTSLSLVESLLVALEADGVEAHTTNENAAGLPFNPVHVFVVHDQDYDRAITILQSVRVAVEPVGARRGPRRRALQIIVLALVALLAVFCAEVFLR